MGHVRVYQAGYKHGYNKKPYMHHRTTRYLYQQSYDDGFRAGSQDRQPNLNEGTTKMSQTESRTIHVHIDEKVIHVAMLRATMDVVDVLGDVFKTQAAEGGAPEEELLKVDDLVARINRRVLTKIQLLQTAEPKKE